jgi:hypothetical protein
MAAAFSLSTFVIGPAVTEEAPEPPAVENSTDHDHGHED